MAFQSRTLDGERMFCHGVLTRLVPKVWLAIYFFCLSSLAFAGAQPLAKVQVSHIGDTSHFEISGLPSWVYSLHRTEINGKTAIVLQVPMINSTSKDNLRSWSTPLIQSVKVDSNSAPDGRVNITFFLRNPTVQSFDYQTDQPSRLIVDFFTTKPKKIKVVKKAPPKQNGLAQVIRIEKNGSWSPQRRPASSEIIKVPKPPAIVTKDELQDGIFDSADPNYDRFKVQSYEINPDAIIASRQNIYLHFPALNPKQKYFKKLLSEPPIYEIKPDKSVENQTARLLLKLYKEHHYGSFLRAYDFFNKKYPTSRYRQLVGYLHADTLFNLWQANKNPQEFFQAMSDYQALLTKYPHSPLAQRTEMVVGYSYLHHKNYLEALRLFDQVKREYPHSVRSDYAQLAISQALLGLHRYNDARRELKDLEKHAVDPKRAIEALYRYGDISFQQHRYAQAIKDYKRAIKSHPEAKSEYPNAFFNMAESLFFLGHYRQALNAHRKFLELFPTLPHDAYSMTRIGELMEILGVDRKRAMGAFLECYFRFDGSPAANVARIRLIGQQMITARSDALAQDVKEADQIAKTTELPQMPAFVNVVISDGYYKRKQFHHAIRRLISFYQTNTHSQALPQIKKRIVRDITGEIKYEIDNGKFLAGLKTYGRFANSWLQGTNRIDIRYYLGKAFEQAGVFKDASRYYRDTLNRIYALSGTKEQRAKTVLENLPSPDRVSLRLAQVALDRRQYPKAWSYIKNIRDPQKLPPQDKIERVEIAAHVAEKFDRPQEASRYLSDLIESWKGQPALVASPLLQLAKMQLQLKTPQDALISLQKILDLQTDTHLVPDDIYAQALQLQGDTYLRQKHFKKALNSYKTLLAKFEKTRPLESVRYRVGTLEYNAGDLNQAKTDWAPLANDPDPIWYQLAQNKMASGKFSQQYQKYINRIPAMADAKGLTNATH